MVITWLMKILALKFFIFDTSDSVCINGNGCSEIQSCDVEFVDEKIYGCKGIWYSDGLDNAEYICANNYHICTSHIEASNLGLTSDICSSTSLLQPNQFYVSRASSSGALTCDDTGTDDLFGCGSPNNDDGWLWFGDSDDPINCGPYSASLSTTSAHDGFGWKWGWEPWSSGSDQEAQQELLNIEHRHVKIDDGYGNWYYTNQTLGGVLCCINEQTNTTMYSTTESIITDCDGCSQDATCDVEFVANTIYGCGGIWQDSGIENAQYLCGDDYEICYDGDIATEMGLSQADCLNKPKSNHFYATAAHSFGNSECNNYNVENTSKPLGYDDVFGCGNSVQGWITTQITQYINCGAFTSKLAWNPFDESKYGWEIRDIDSQNELKSVRHLFERNSNNKTIGGVMCCKKNSVWEPWQIEQSVNEDHTCKVSTGCTQTNSLVSCDIEFVPERIYGCSGKWETQGIQNGEWICRAGYSICSTKDIVEEYGLTKEMCASYPKNNYFYATYSSSNSQWNKVYNGYICEDQLESEEGVFGCGLDVASNWLWTISEWRQAKAPVSCGPYTAILNRNHYNKEYGWIISDDGQGKEKYYTKHLKYENGGVLCCRNLGESTFEPEYIPKMVSFYSARISEIISLFITIIITILSIKQYRKLKSKRMKRIKFSRSGNGIDIIKILTFLAYFIYFISILQLIWMIITIWLLSHKYDKVERSLNCKIRSQGLTIFYAFYKLTFYLFMIYKIEASLKDSIYAYHKSVYISLKIFAVLVFIGYGTLLSNQLVQYTEFGAIVGGGYDCYMIINQWILWIGGIVDAVLSIIFTTMFGYKLYSVIRTNEGGDSKKLQAVIFKNTLLSLIALSSTWMFYYIGFQGTNFLGWFASLDFAINNLCIWLMFKHNQMIFKKLCCGCFIFCGFRCAEKNTKYLRKGTGINSMTTQSPSNKRNEMLPTTSPPSTTMINHNNNNCLEMEMPSAIQPTSSINDD